MAAKSILKSSASALLALALGTAALVPASASAQERPDRGERGAGRMERQERAAPAQAPAWQNRAPAQQQQQPSWQGRPTFSQGGGAPAPQPQRQGGWQGGGERGDRGNGANPVGQPTFGRPAWANNGGGQPAQGGTPTWQGRNPTYVDPARGGNRNLPAEGRGQAWNQQGQSRWYHNDNGTWRNDPGRAWAGNGDRRDGDRRDGDRRDGDRRDGDRDRRDWQQNRGNSWGYNNGWRDNDNRWRGNNGWRGNAWGYNNGYRTWDRDGWRRDNRYNWYGWRNSHRDIFSLGFYSAPWRGYSYSRFSIGVVIGAPFYAEQYWIADPWAYRLPPVDGPYRWVRYYDDALLVNIYTGEVVDAIYDIFY